MNELKEKKAIDKIYKTFMFWIIIGLGIAIILAFIFVHIGMYWDDNKIIVDANGNKTRYEWIDSAGDWIALIVGGLGAIATAELGYVAIW